MEGAQKLAPGGETCYQSGVTRSKRCAAFCETEIADVWPALCIKQNIGRLQIAMQHALLMCLRDGAGNRRKGFGPGLDTPARCSAPGVAGFATAEWGRMVDEKCR